MSAGRLLHVVRFPLVAFAALAIAIVADQVRADEALVLIPSEVQAGGQSAATVTALRGEDRAPVDRGVTVVLIDGATRHEVGAGRTGADGHARIPLDIPALESGLYRLEASVDGVTEKLGAETRVSNTPAILIETDKPIYKPGQTIQGRVLLLDSALRPRTGAVELSILDAKGIRVHRAALDANEYGVAPFDLVLANEVNFGVWKIDVVSEGLRSSRDVRVENYVLPRFELGAEFERGWVLVDEPISGRVEARYFFGRPVDGEVQIVARRYIGDWEVFATAGGPLVDGAFDFQLPPVQFTAGTPGANGLGTVTLDITATDSTGHAESTTELLTVSQAPVVVRLVSRNGSVKPEIPIALVVTSEEPDGTPIDASVEVTARFRDFDQSVLAETSVIVDTSGGNAAVTFTPPARTAQAVFTATTIVDGRSARADLELAAAWSPSSTFLALARRSPAGRVRVGEELRFEAIATHPGSVFYEVYAGGRTVFSDVADGREIRFTATPEMAPSARLVAYSISPNNEVAADTLPFEVDLAATLSVSSAVDRDELRPGDEITLTIDTGERAMVGLAIVDRSVLALGRSRLHLGEVFEELERRFLEPKGEPHDAGGPNGAPPPLEDRFFQPVHSPGAADIIAGVGLTLVATSGLRAPTGRDFFRFDEDMLEDGPPPPVAAPNGGDDGSAPDAVRVRQFFPETWVWNPTLLTGEDGRATLTLTVPDSITSWSVSTVATAPGGIGFGASELTVFQEFFVEPNLPVAVTRGEEFPVRIQIFNYVDAEQSVALELGDGEWFELLGDADLSVNVPAGSAIAADFPIRPVRVGSHEVRLVARGSLMSDAVVRKITVEPEGEPAERVLNSVIQSGAIVDLDTSLPVHAVPDSGSAYLYITPSPVAQTLTGISSLLNMPFGCGEQNMIFLAPDVEVLRYLKATDQSMPEVQAQAEYFINVGYQRQLTFQADDGGFAAFGGRQASLWLTAFVLSTFSIAREVRDIDESVLERAASMLAGRQKSDGSFRTDDFLIHKEMDGGLSNIYAMAAYVTNALADFGGDSTSSTLQRAATYLRDGRSQAGGDPYSLSIAAVALGKVAGFEGVARAIVDGLLEVGKRDGIGIHWEPYPIETTGYVALALLAQDRPEAASAVEWLSTQRNSLGGYGESTQDTVVAIRALTEAALRVRADLDVTLTVLDGETPASTIRVDDSNYDVLQTVELPVGRASGLSLRSEGTGNVGFQLAVGFHVPAEELPPPNDMEIDVVYDARRVEVDDLVDVRVRVLYSGAKERTGMTIVDIGVPTGFAAVRSTLDALVEAGTASRVDVAGRKVIVYLDGLDSGVPVEFGFQVRALYPVRAEAPVSKVFEYYDPDVQASIRGKPVVISERDDRPGIFVRGDANSDDSVDISDAVRILGFLFLGAELDCVDRADVDDDGIVVITDAIALLNYLFQDGRAPREPFPVAGEDPTPDNLECR